MPTVVSKSIYFQLSEYFSEYKQVNCLNQIRPDFGGYHEHTPRNFVCKYPVQKKKKK